VISPKVLEAWQSCSQWFSQSYSKPDSLYHSDLSQSTGSQTILFTVISPIQHKARHSLSQWSLPKYWKPDDLLHSDFPNPTQSLTVSIKVILPQSTGGLTMMLTVISLTGLPNLRILSEISGF
jgi:hypothetical protein